MKCVHSICHAQTLKTRKLPGDWLLASSVKAAFTLSHLVIGPSQHSQILPPTPEKMILPDAVQIVHRHFLLLLQSPRHYQTCYVTLKKVIRNFLYSSKK